MVIQFILIFYFEIKWIKTKTFLFCLEFFFFLKSENNKKNKTKLTFLAETFATKIKL